MTPSANPMLLSDEEFEKQRYTQDVEADVVALTVLNALDPMEVYQILGGIQKNTDLASFESIKKLPHAKDPSAAGNEEVLTFFKKTIDKYFNDLKFFQFTEEEKKCLSQASTFFNLHMTECTLALATRSLLKQYAAYKSTNVLVYTQLLPKYPYRRILSTMQFVMDVMDPKAFEPDGYGIRSIQKLRLVHALIRNRIEVNSLLKVPGKEWNNDWGYPINQQDMIFAIHTFSLEVLHGLIASGEEVSVDEIQNYYKAWHLIGRALGVKDSMNPSDYFIGVKVQNRIYAKEFIKDNPNGPILAEPLIQFLVEVLPMAKRKGVLGLVKLFNDKKDYEPIFKDILKLDLAEASSFYTTMYNTADQLQHWLLKVKYFFLPNAKRSDYFADVAKNQHKFFDAIMGAAITWSDTHFRIADGFGTGAAEEDAAKSKALPPLWKRVLLKILPKNIAINLKLTGEK
jgi:hypothetical protein